MERRSCTNKIQSIIDASLQKNPKKRKRIDEICQLPAIAEFFKDEDGKVVAKKRYSISLRKKPITSRVEFEIPSKKCASLKLKTALKNPMLYGFLNAPQSTPKPQSSNEIMNPFAEKF